MGQQGSFFEIDRKEISTTTTKSRSRSQKSSAPRNIVLDCSTCGLSKNCRNPRIKRYGKGNSGILIVGLCPGRQEDALGIPFVGPSGDLLKRQLGYVGLNLDQDCIRTNIVSCFKDTDPTKEQILACRKNLIQDIREVQPKLIICLGEQAINAVLKVPDACNFSSFSAKMMHGRVVPSEEFNCWVVGAYHPSFFLRRKNRTDVPDDENLLAFDVAKALSYLSKPLPKPLTKEGNILLDTVAKVQSALKMLGNSKTHVAYDYETTTLSPFHRNARGLSIALSNDVNTGYFIPIDIVNPTTGRVFFNPEEKFHVFNAIREFLKSPAPKAVQNLNMEEIWNRVYFKQASYNFEELVESNTDGLNHIYDTMIGAHVLNGNTGTTGLAFQVFEMTGHDYKCMVDARDMARAPLDAIFHYNSWDARYTRMALEYQFPRIILENRIAEFSQLFQTGALALVNLTERGVPISEEAMRSLEVEYSQEAEQRKVEMRTCKGIPAYEQYAKKEFNPESPQQLSTILYKYYKVEPFKGTLSTDIDALEKIIAATRDEEVKKLVNAVQRFRKCTSLLKRAKNYRGLIDKNWFVHPTFNLNTVDTFRSSADNPSIQNIFKHDKELKKFRRVIKASPGNILLEVDFDALEVKVIAMDSRDAELTRQIVNGVDTHRRWSSEIFLIPESEITSEQRFDAKNSFVFASFYGAIWETIAPKFPMLRKEHIKEVQEKFWREFQGVKAWQIQNTEKYICNGFIEGMSGFRCYGPLNINKICNYPIQGTAFHLMLDSIIRIEKEFAKRKLRSKPLFEIHDSLTIDTVPQEAAEVVQIVTEIMTSKRFEWQGIVPLTVSWEIGKSCWFDLQPLKMIDNNLCVVVKENDTKKNILLDDFIKVGG